MKLNNCLLIQLKKRKDKEGEIYKNIKKKNLPDLLLTLPLKNLLIHIRYEMNLK